MTTVSVEEAKSKLPELIRQLSSGEEVVITENNQPVARLVPAVATKQSRKLGTMQGTVQHISPDFDAPLDDFKDYMR